MKQLIVLAAVLPIMMIFLVQFGLDQRNNLVMSILQQEVYTAKEEAKQEGYFSEDIVNRLKDSLSAKLGISQEDVLVVASDIIKYRVNYFDPGKERGLIYYSVSVPVGKLMAGGNLLGIKAEDNKTVYTVEGMTASEKLPEGMNP